MKVEASERANFHAVLRSVPIMTWIQRQAERSERFHQGTVNLSESGRQRLAHCMSELAKSTETASPPSR